MNGNGHLKEESIDDDSSFNLIYQRLQDKSSTLDDDLISKNWSHICAVINKLPSDHVHVIFLLILHHGITNNPSLTDRLTPSLKGKSRQIYLPYSGKVLDSGKGAIYKMSSLPPDLQKIIHTYIDIISE